jgi:hypothetical protein
MGRDILLGFHLSPRFLREPGHQDLIFRFAHCELSNAMRRARRKRGTDAILPMSE